MPRRKMLSDLNPATMPGPGDLWRPPEDDDEYSICEICGEEFSYDPIDYIDADEDGKYCDPPTICGECGEKEDGTD